MKIWHPIWIFAAFWILPALWRFFAVCAKQGARWFFAICAKFGIFAKIATLHGATFGIQFEWPAFWHFLPFSPLHAFLDISGSRSREYKQWPAALQSSVLPTELILLRLSLLKLSQRWARRIVDGKIYLRAFHCGSVSSVSRACDGLFQAPRESGPLNWESANKKIKLFANLFLSRLSHYLRAWNRLSVWLQSGRSQVRFPRPDQYSGLKITQQWRFWLLPLHCRVAQMTT